MKVSRRVEEYFVTLPSGLWLLLLFVLPTFVVLAIAFRPSDPFGGIGEGWTFDTLMGLGNPNYPAIIWRTVWLSFATTVICILAALPVSYYMARVSPSWRMRLMLLVIVPFWTSFLVRIFAWKVVLHPNGTFKALLVWLGLITDQTMLLYRSEAVLLVMVYTFLPFAILPIYAAAEKFDMSLLEAARDLGAGRLTAFFRIFIPGIKRGLITAILVVFIPALGSYVIPDLVGGPQGEMIGNKIAQRTFVDRNLPHASALAAVLTLTVLLPLIGVMLVQGAKSGPIIREDA